MTDEDLDFLWTWIRRLRYKQITLEEFISVVWYYPENPLLKDTQPTGGK